MAPLTEILGRAEQWTTWPLFAVPLFTMALVEGSVHKDARDLGPGMVFASLRIEGTQESNRLAFAFRP